jgi:hypothetical protein
MIEDKNMSSLDVFMGVEQFVAFSLLTPPQYPVLHEAFHPTATPN